MKSNRFMVLHKNLFFALFMLLGLPVVTNAQIANVTSGCAPLPVAFKNTKNTPTPFWQILTSPPVSFIVDNPQYTFSQSGKFKVYLRQGSATGAILDSTTISVFPKPELVITATPTSGCSPLQVQFQVTVNKLDPAMAATYSWAFGDGGAANAQSPKYTYNTIGNYTPNLDLTVGNMSGCNSTKAGPEIKVSAGPDISFTTDKSVACTPPLTVNFTNTSASTNAIFSWNLPTGNDFNGKDLAPQTLTQNGTYTYKLSGTLNGCTKTVSKEIVIGKPKADFNLPNDTLCINSDYTLANASSDGNYTWNFGTGATPATSTAKDPTVRWTTPGTKTIKLTVTSSSDATCSSEVTKTVYIDNISDKISINTGKLCQSPVSITYSTTNKYTKYDWFFYTQNPYTSADAQPVVKWTNYDPSGYSQLGSFGAKVELNVTSASGCKLKLERVDTIALLNARIVPDKWQGCAPLTVNFADSSFSKAKITAYRFLWGDGTAAETFSDKATRSHTFTKAGEYKVRMIATNADGCIDTSHVIVIEVGTKIKPDFSIDKTTICVGDTVRLKDLSNNPNIDAWHYDVEEAKGHQCYGQKDLTWIYSTVGTKNITLTVGYNGCFESTTKNALVNVRGPVAEIAYFVPCAPNNKTVEFKSQSQDATNLEWNFGDGSPLSALATVNHTYVKDSTYIVKLTATNSNTGCKASTDSVKIHITDLKAEFELVNEGTGLPANNPLCNGTEYKLVDKSKDIFLSCFSGHTLILPEPEKRPLSNGEKEIKFTVQKENTYSLLYIVKDINGCLDTIKKDYGVNTVKTKITLPDEICLPRTVALSGEGTTSSPNKKISKWTWEFGDGQKDESNKEKLNHTYAYNPSAKTFIVTLKVEDEDQCPGSISDTIKVYYPQSFVSVVRNPICINEQANITASDFTLKGNKLENFVWSVNGVNIPNNTIAFPYTFTTEGTKQVKVTYRESNTLCIGEAQASVEVQAPPTGLDFVTSNICDNINVTFSPIATSDVSKIANGVWTINGETLNGKSVTKSLKEGQNTIKLVAATSAGCSSTVEKSFEKFPKATAGLTLSKTSICLGDEVTFDIKNPLNVKNYTFGYGDGSTTSTLPSTKKYDNAALHPLAVNKVYLQLTLFNGNDCTNLVRDSITVNRVIPAFSVPNSICAGTELSLINQTQPTTNISNEWDFGNGDKSQSANPKYTYTKAGDYTITLKATQTQNNCVGSTSQSINIKSQASGDFDSKSYICFGDTASFNLKNIVADSWTFDFGDGTNSSNVNNEVLKHYYTDLAGSEKKFKVKLILSNKNNCNPLPIEKDVTLSRIIANYQVKGDTCLRREMQFNNTSVAANPYNSSWTFGDGKTSTDKSPTHSYTSAGDYKVNLQVTDTKSGCTNSKETNLSFVPEQEVSIPTIFSPKEGEEAAADINVLSNSNFKPFYINPKVKCNVEITEYVVFNRWGEVVYKGSGIWNGKKNNTGDDLPSDVYVVLVYLSNGTRETKDVTLIR